MIVKLIRIYKFLLSHKVISIIGIIIFFGAVYFGYRHFKTNDVSVRYVTAAAEKGLLISSISGTGQVTASNQADIKSNVSGDILAVNVTSGETITSSTVLALIEGTEAQKELRNARIAYDQAKLDLDELVAPAEEIDIIKAESALDAAKRDLDALVSPSEDDLYDAESALTNSKEDLLKLKNDQAKAYKDAIGAKEDADNELVEAYEDSYNLLTEAFFDLPTVISGLYDLIYAYDISDNQGLSTRQINMYALKNTIDVLHEDEYDIDPLIDTAKEDYAKARDIYDATFAVYKTLTRDAEYADIEEQLAETLDTVRLMGDTVKSENNLYDFWVDYRITKNLPVFNQVTSNQSDIQSYTSKTNNLVTSLLAQQRTLQDAKAAIEDADDSLQELKREQPLDLAAAERDVKDKEDAFDKLKNPQDYDIEDLEIAVKEKEIALQELKDGADDIDIRAKRITLQEKYEILLEALDNVESLNVKAPFDGTVATVEVAVGDTVNSGTLIASVITPQKIVEVTLNEVDIASVKMGQSATITFDAVPDLTVTGKVVEVDALGAVSQGVVSYNVKIAFDVQDDRIKPGMSTSVSIITGTKADALLIPLSAVKTSGIENYVDVLVNNTPQRRTVVTGESNDTMIEITDGLNEGEEVVSQTLTSGSPAASGSNSSENNRGFQSGAGSFMRIIR